MLKKSNIKKEFLKISFKFVLFLSNILPYKAKSKVKKFENQHEHNKYASKTTVQC